MTKIPLSIVTLGHVHTDDLMPLGEHFSSLEQLVLDVAPRVELTTHRAELNRAIDAATSDWILIIREREQPGPELAKEMAAAAGENPRAWGYRIRTEPFYAGAPLKLGEENGELRLFHRRHFLRRGEMSVQGTVIRLSEPLRGVTFESTTAHEDYLKELSEPVSRLRRMLLFASYVAAARTLDRNTRHYLWIEAGYSPKKK